MAFGRAYVLSAAGAEASEQGLGLGQEVLGMVWFWLWLVDGNPEVEVQPGCPFFFLVFENGNVPEVWPVRAPNFRLSSSVIFHLGGLAVPSPVLSDSLSS